MRLTLMAYWSMRPYSDMHWDAREWFNGPLCRDRGSTMFTYLLILLLGSTAVRLAPDTAGIPDDFEWCTPGFTIAPHAQSRPWLRFGDATRDQVYPTLEPAWVIGGQFSARYDLGWPASFAKVRKYATAPTDLTEFATISIWIRTTHPDSRTRVRLDLYDGRSTCLSRESFLLTTETRQAVFTLDPNDLEVVDGHGAVEALLASCQAVGLHFESSDGEYSETIIFDDLDLTWLECDNDPVVFKNGH